VAVTWIQWIGHSGAHLYAAQLLLRDTAEHMRNERRDSLTTKENLGRRVTPRTRPSRRRRKDCGPDRGR
jgi:hypothetical protein